MGSSYGLSAAVRVLDTSRDRVMKGRLMRAADLADPRRDAYVPPSLMRQGERFFFMIADLWPI